MSVSSLFSLIGKRALVTGADRGIGQVMAGAGEHSDEDWEVKAMRIGSSVEKAGEHSDEDWEAVLRVNLDAPFRLARAISGRLLAQGSGKIIFTASLRTFQGGINVPGYAASKGAIGSLVKALANEWAGRSVSAIAPGYVATDNTHVLGHLRRLPGPGRVPGLSRQPLRARHHPPRERRLAGPLNSMSRCQ